MIKAQKIIFGIFFSITILLGFNMSVYAAQDEELSGLIAKQVVTVEETKVVYGEEFLEAVVDIAESGTPYILGGFSRKGVDCTNYVRLALDETYGNHTMILESNPEIQIELGTTSTYLGNFKDYVGERFYIEGNDMRCYYTVLVADRKQNIDGLIDISVPGYKYSSIISYAQQFPGSIICFNGHAGIGMGIFESKEEFLEKYPGLDRKCSGFVYGNEDIVKFSDTWFDIGEQEVGTNKYWFGKTMEISASNSAKGIRAYNNSVSGRYENVNNNSECAILMCEQEPELLIKNHFINDAEEASKLLELLCKDIISSVPKEDN